MSSIVKDAPSRLGSLILAWLLSQHDGGTPHQITKALQEISIKMIKEGDVKALYEQILDAAIAVMLSNMASIQILDEGQDALRMLAFRGFGPEFGKIFELNGPDTRTSCGVGGPS